jgi:hypothetical protein
LYPLPSRDFQSPLRVFIKYVMVMIRAQNYTGQTIDGRIVVCEIHVLFLFNSTNLVPRAFVLRGVSLSQHEGPGDEVVIP